ncbi:MAG: hypothetical protein AAGB22_01120 [Bacteroidota bacterium]
MAMRIPVPGIALFWCLLWCSACQPSRAPECADTASADGIHGALLASRFATMEDLGQALTIHYGTASGLPDSAEAPSDAVQLAHCSNGRQVISRLATGVDENDFRKARDGDFWDRLSLGLQSPYVVAHRQELQQVVVLSRRMRLEFGVGDVAFYDLAEAMVDHIITEDLAYRNARDSSEKGYINSFNHLTAQAFVTSVYSEELADFIADVHERYNMPELISGQFTAAQQSDPDNNPVDNYVDMINNEWGQEVGKQLGATYGLSPETRWTPELLTAYLNDLQQYYSWAFQVGMRPFRQEEEVVTRFSTKVNRVMQNDW